MGKRGNGEGTITKRSDGRWMAALVVGKKPDGTPRRTYFYGKTRKEVQKKLSEVAHQVSNGIFIEPKKTTVAQWLGVWLEEYAKPKLRATTYDSYEVMIRVHLKPTIGGLLLKDLRPEHLQALYNEKLQKGRADGKGGLSSRTVHYIHATIHQALEQAVKNQLVLRNVAKATTLPKESKMEIQPLTMEQVHQFLGSVRDDSLYPAFLLELGTGLRRGELLGLRWQDVDLDTGSINVRQNLVRVRNHDSDGKKTMLVFQEPKTKQSRRTIHLPQDITAELKIHRRRMAEEKLMLGQEYEDNDLVFCVWDGKPIDPRNFTRHFEALLKKACLPHIRFHDARHTFATLLLELGEHPKVVQEMLGHSKITMTLDTYSHVFPELKRQAADKLNNVLTKRKIPSTGEGTN